MFPDGDLATCQAGYDRSENLYIAWEYREIRDPAVRPQRLHLLGDLVDVAQQEVWRGKDLFRSELPLTCNACCGALPIISLDDVPEQQGQLKVCKSLTRRCAHPVDSLGRDGRKRIGAKI